MNNKKKTIPEVIIKFSKQRNPLEKLRRGSNWLSCKRKIEDKVWKEFKIILMVENYQNCFRKQNKYEKQEVNQKLKHEN